VVAYLIDSVTGQILHRITHPSMQGPVHAVLSLVFVFFWVCIFLIPKILSVTDFLIVSFIDVSCLGVAGPEQELGCVSLLQSLQSSI